MTEQAAVVFVVEALRVAASAADATLTDASTAAQTKAVDPALLMVVFPWVRAASPTSVGGALTKMKCRNRSRVSATMS